MPTGTLDISWTLHWKADDAGMKMDWYEVNGFLPSLQLQIPTP